MLITVFSPKGGSGTSTCAALVAKSFSQNFSLPTMLIDAHNGDIETVIGVDSESEYGFVQWADAKLSTANNLSRISSFITDNFSFVSYSSVKNDRYVDTALLVTVEEKQIKAKQIVDALSNNETNYIVDIGTRVNETTNALVEASDLVIMVMKGCYVSLNRASAHPYTSSTDTCIVISEPGRTITTKQISDVLKLNCIIEIEARRDFAKCIDAGILIFRTPRNMINAVDKFVIDVREYLKRTSKRNFDQEVNLSRKANFDRSEKLKNENYDIFDDAKNGNKRDFWSQEERSTVRQSARATRPVDISYTSHLHNALAGINNKGRR